MRKNLIFGTLAAVSLSFAACSDDNNLAEITPDVNNDDNKEQVEIGSEYKTLVGLDFESHLGTIDGSSFSSRTLGDVDDEFRPGTKYFLDNIFMLALNPTKQPTDEEASSIIGKAVTIHYDRDASTMEEHNVSHGAYKLKYRLGDNVVDNSEQKISNSGSIFLSPTGSKKDELEFKLSVFELKDLQEPEDGRIALNKFAFNHGLSLVRGTTLRYTSYDPFGVGQELTASLQGRYVSLPEAQGLDFLKDESEIGKILVDETPDQYFSGSEFLIAADNDKIYLLKVVNEENFLGGYFEVRSYPTPKGDANPESLELNRLTAVVNASFMITDDKAHTASYYNKNSDTSVANFKSKYNIDLETMTCPYATLDGVNQDFFINDYTHDDKTQTPARLVLWAEDHPVLAANGQEYTKLPEASNDINYSTHTGDREVKIQGFGIQGRSYSVIFPGNQNDTANKMVQFFVMVDGVKVRIQAAMPHLGISFNTNIAHNLIVSVPESKFVKAVNRAKKQAKTNSRAGNDFVDLNLSSDHVVVR